MSLTDFIHPVQSQTDGADEYDHAIVLIDASKPAKVDPGALHDDGTASLSKTGSGAPLSKRWTKSSLREELVRRKYAKWQDDKNEDTGEPVEGTYSVQSAVADGATSQQPGSLRRSLSRPDRIRGKNPFRKKKGASKKAATDDTYVDILYENQRGWFICGIPLYSHQSLLPTDPPAWQTATFTYSPVNITNAQLPDPSWAWAWRTWYVDMSYDVDDEGWQYSFNFSPGWEWHGTHPWFHSFVRRRRWLRKRVKLYPSRAVGGASTLQRAHMLGEDYFTIHAMGEKSRDSSADRKVKHRSSFSNNARNESDTEQDPDDISDILKLMAALKRARVDREKMWAVRAFLDQGGDELFYLADRMDEIISLFIYRTSRRQLQSILLDEHQAAKTQMQKDEEDERDVDEALDKKANYLLKAIRATKTSLESESTSDGTDSKAGNNTQNTGDVNLDDSFLEDLERESVISGESAAVGDEIPGIPKAAEISHESGLRLDGIQDQDHDPALSGKGKERA